MGLEQKIQPSKVFCISNGWLQGFLGRYTIVSRVLSGESESVDLIQEEKEEKVFERLAQGGRHLFNDDETKLYFQIRSQRESLEFHYFGFF